jgi:hypothetical protein
MHQELGADFADGDRLTSPILDRENDSGIVSADLDVSIGRDV